MAGLYRRYIPPATTATATAQDDSYIDAARPQSAEQNAEKKRKRERSEDEKAERKAKKSRKKGEQPAGHQHDTANVNARGDSPAVDVVDAKHFERQGTFAHIKSTKKRHKLEKEARKARKAIGKAPNIDKAKEDHGAPDDSTTSPVHLVATPQEVGVLQALPSTVRPSDFVEPQLPSDGREAGSEDSETASSKGVDVLPTAPKPYSDGIVTKPKKRRHKLEKVLTERSNGTAEDDGSDYEEHMKRHGTVLGKFQRSQHLAQRVESEPAIEKATSPPRPHLRDLAPFPQPDLEIPAKEVSAYSALPYWLANPTVVPNTARIPIKNLALPSSTAERLSALGFATALPVQQAVIPLLLPPGSPGSSFRPGTQSVLPDLAISAPTGSGKTMAYLLPIFESLKHQRGPPGRLRVLIVVPTRELVSQVADVAEKLVRGDDIKIGTASGTGKLRDEQQHLIRVGQRYDPHGYRAAVEKAQCLNYPPSEGSHEFEAYLEELQNQTTNSTRILEDTVAGLTDHFPTYESAVDILICTPGRLAEHLNSTVGFSVVHVSWLVLDEADKLLNQGYDDILERLQVELSKSKAEHEQDARERHVRQQGFWDDAQERKVRKIILSATMTRDISKLTALRLRRPKLIVISGTEHINGGDDVHRTDNGTGPTDHEKAAFELPPTLEEYCVPAGDGGDKPLILLNLLKSNILRSSSDARSSHGTDSESTETESNEVSSVDESESESASESEAESTESTLNDEGTDQPMALEEKVDESHDDRLMPDSARRRSTLDLVSQVEQASTHKDSNTPPTVLVFTASNEAASRLSHLLRQLRPDLARHITSLTKTTPGSNIALRGKPSDPHIVISTDRAGRGLDTLSGRDVTHVLQYDVPRSVVSYVHRVGRTARAGRPGQAWTLYTSSEARWFIKDVTKAESVRRIRPVEKIKLASDDPELADKYKDVLAGMRDMVFRGTRRRTTIKDRDSG